MTSPSPTGVDVGGLSIDLAEAEVLGLAGLEGSGQRTFLRGCAGLIDADRGSIVLDGVDLTKRRYDDYRAAGVHLLPAGRLEEGLVPGLTISRALRARQRQPFVLRRLGRGRVDGPPSASPATRSRAPSSRPPSRCPAATSNGCCWRCCRRDVRLLLMEHPTRGLDIESAAWVWTQLLERRNDGTGIIFASADLDELLRYSDRIAVFFEGRILEVVDATATDTEELGHLIGGRRAMKHLLVRSAVAVGSIAIALAVAVVVCSSSSTPRRSRRCACCGTARSGRWRSCPTR